MQWSPGDKFGEYMNTFPQIYAIDAYLIGDIFNTMT
jgi:hypothetical protein